MSLWSRIANVFRGDRLSRDIDEEIESHIEEAVEQGRDPAEARRAFGSALRRREESRDVRLIPWLDSLRADAVFGWRQLLKRKVTSTAAILSLGLALGACTSAFRLIDALLLRPLPVAGAERLFALSHLGVGNDGKPQVFDGFEYPLFQQMRSAVNSEAEMLAISTAHRRTDLTYGSDQKMEKARLQHVSDGRPPLRDRRGSRTALHRRRDRQRNGCLRPHYDASRGHSCGLELDSDAGAAEAGRRCRTGSREAALGISGIPRGEGPGSHGNAQTAN